MRKLATTLILIFCFVVVGFGQFSSPGPAQYLEHQNLYYQDGSAIHVRNYAYTQLEVGTYESTYWGVFNTYGYYNSGQWGDLRGVVHRYGFPLCFSSLDQSYANSTCIYAPQDEAKVLYTDGTFELPSIILESDNPKPDCEEEGQMWVTKGSATVDSKFEICLWKQGVLQWVEK